MKTAVVTGGTDGIGRAVAAGLASSGHRVIVIGRDPEKGRRVERELRDETRNGDVSFVAADLALVRDTIRLARTIAPTDIDVLVHGAGIVRGRRVLTDEGIESNFAVNYLARFVLTTHLLPSLATGSRIVILGGAARSGEIQWDDPNLTRGFGTLRAVKQFCRANDIFTVELARRLKSSTVTCLKIGVVKTNIRREFPGWMKVLVPLVLDPLIGKTPSEVASHVLALATSPAFEGVNGARYSLIRRFVELPADPEVSDPAIGKKLWALSEHLSREDRRASEARTISM